MRMFADVDFGRGVEDAFSNIASFVPKLLGFLVILIIGYFIVKIIAKILDKALERVGFDRAVERGGVKKILDKSKYDASDLISKVVFYGLFLLVLQAAFGVFGTNPVSDLIASVIAFLPKVVVAIVIVVVAAAIAAAVKELVQTALAELSYGKALANGAAIAIIVVGIFAALNQVEIAPEIVNGLFYAVLAIVVGSAVIGIGGASIQPLRQYIERGLQRVDEETSNVRRAGQGAGERVQRRAEQLKAQAQTQTSSTDPGATSAR